MSDTKKPKGFQKGHKPVNGFKKGNTLGKGRPPVDPELKAAKKLTKTRAEELFSLYMHKTAKELDAICKNSNTTVLEAMIARVAQQAIRDGDQRRLDFMLDRTVGKVKEVTEIQLPKPMIVENLEGDSKLLGAIEAEVVEDDKL